MADKVSGVLTRYLAGGSWKRNVFSKKGRGSQTPGRAKSADTCRLTSVAGYPRKAMIRARAYKLGDAYTQWCKFTSGLKGNSSRT